MTDDLPALDDIRVRVFAGNFDDARTLLAAIVVAVLELADEWEELPYRDMAQAEGAAALRDVITRVLTPGAWIVPLDVVAPQE